MNVADMWHTFLAGYSARDFALLVLIAILVGNFLCESGNLLAGRLGLPAHYFNKWFLIIGLLGMCGFGVALFGRRCV